MSLPWDVDSLDRLLIQLINAARESKEKDREKDRNNYSESFGDFGPISRPSTAAKGDSFMCSSLFLVAVLCACGGKKSCV